MTGTTDTPSRDAARAALVATLASRGTSVAQGEVDPQVRAAAFVRQVEDRQDEAHLLVLDGGPGGGEASTIVDATGLAETPPRPARIVRQGALERERLAAVLGEWLAPAEDG